MKTAIVLSGGGARGAFQVGVIKALRKRNNGKHEFDVVYGTSVGALNAAGLAHLGLDKLERVWREIKGRSDVLSLNWFNLFFGNGLYSMAPLRKLIWKNLITTQSLCEAVACYCDLDDQGKVKYASNREVLFDQFVKFIEASSAIPLVMEPVDERYVDGGVREQTPLKYAIDRGAEKIIVVLCSPFTDNPLGPWVKRFPKSLSVGMRALEIRDHEIFLNDIKHCLQINDMVKLGAMPEKRVIDIEIFSPSKPLVDALDFNPASIASMIQDGELTPQWSSIANTP